MATFLHSSSLQQCTSFTPFPHSSLPSNSISVLSSSRFSLKFRVYACCQTQTSPTPSPLPTSIGFVNGNADLNSIQRSEIRFGLPSKGRMASDTLQLLKVSILLCFWFDFIDFCKEKLIFGFLMFCSVFDIQDCQLSVRQANPRQYVAQIPQVLSSSFWYVFECHIEFRNWLLNA